MQGKRQYLPHHDTEWLGLGLILAGVLGLAGVNPPSVPRPSQVLQCLEQRAVAKAEKMIAESPSKPAHAAQSQELTLQPAAGIMTARTELIQLGSRLISVR
ncbi:MAG TPA: hypothetical protein VK473_02505 [Terriglobales bacterium]|nr:hypothetical protein [Terriglobales bacterium]